MMNECLLGLDSLTKEEKKQKLFFHQLITGRHAAGGKCAPKRKKEEEEEGKKKLDSVLDHVCKVLMIDDDGGDTQTRAKLALLEANGAGRQGAQQLRCTILRAGRNNAGHK